MIDTGFGSFYLPPSSLLNTPSFIHGVPQSTEQALRLYSCQIIQDSVILLRLPHAVTATAQVLFHRFFCKRSFREFDARTAAASCVWLAIKLEEEGSSNRGEKRSRLPDVLNVFQRIAYRREGTVLDASDYMEREAALLKTERQILAELGFVCHVDHPHKFLISYLKCLEASPELIQEAWNLVNDSLRTTLCVSFQSNVVACGAIYAAARRLSVPLPESPPWWLLFDVSFEQIAEVCMTLADLYKQPKPQYVGVRECLSSKSAPGREVADDVSTVKELEQPHGSPSLLRNSKHCGKIDIASSNAIAQLLSSGVTAELINSYLGNAAEESRLEGVLVGCMVTSAEGFLDGDEKLTFTNCKKKRDTEKNGDFSCEILVAKQSLNNNDQGQDEGDRRKIQRQDSGNLEISMKRHRQSLRYEEYTHRRNEGNKDRSRYYSCREELRRSREESRSRVSLPCWLACSCYSMEGCCVQWSFQPMGCQPGGLNSQQLKREG